jgi:hypothetical protein
VCKDYGTERREEKDSRYIQESCVPYHQPGYSIGSVARLAGRAYQCGDATVYAFSLITVPWLKDIVAMHSHIEPLHIATSE